MTTWAADEPAAERLVTHLLTRSRGTADRPLVVLDPSWPASMRDSARRAVLEGQKSLRQDDLVVFTSGSAGRPRGIVRTVSSWTASLPALSRILGDRSTDDLVWIPGPLTSSLFLYGAFHAAWSGRQWLRGPVHGDAVQRATHAHLVPLMLTDAVDAADHGLLPMMRTVVVAGAPLSTILRERAEQHGWRVVEYYGAAELSFVGWRADGGPLRPFPGAQVRIGDGEAGERTSLAPTGQIWVRSPYLARRYLCPDEHGPWQVRDGWSTVQDLGRGVPGSAGWTVRGRGNAAITTGGATVLVADVEESLRDVPGVLALAVVAVPDHRFGEVVAALVQPAAGANRADLLVRLRARARDLPSSSRPRRWLQVDRLPRLASGKLDRARAGELAASAPALR